MIEKPVFAAINTLRAGWFELLLVQLFGKKSVSEDSGCIVTLYYWRGKYYLTDFKD